MKDLKYYHTNMDYIKQELYKLDNNKPWRLKVTPWKERRGLSANNQQHLWYAQIASSYDDRLPIDIKNFCKDAIGLPIILQSNVHGDKMEFLLDKLDYYKHSHKSKMMLIQCLELTSLFNTAESKQYMEQMIYYWNDLGVPIKFKD